MYLTYICYYGIKYNNSKLLRKRDDTMAIYSCPNCNNNFNYQQIMLNILFSRSHILQCKKCKNKFRLTHGSGIVSFLLALFIPSTITTSYIIFNKNHLPISFFLFISQVIIFSAFLPFIVKYEKLKNQD